MAAPRRGEFSWRSGFGDVALLPDLAAARILPWMPGAAVVFADPIEGSWPHPLAPTTVLDEQLVGLAALGLTVAVGITAVAWVAVVTVLVCLPQRAPVNAESFNYAPVTLIAVLVLAAVWWRMAGRKYSVPVVDDPQMARLEEQVV